MRIVYVEDNLANFALVERIARVDGHEVINYRSGNDALERYGADDPDMLLVDIQLIGEMNGVEVVRRLREMGCMKPIYVVTAYTTSHDRKGSLEAGATDYVPKPVSVQDLLKLMRACAV